MTSNEKFFLFLGTLEPRKNIVGILKAFNYLKSNGQISDDSHLVIAGSRGWLYGDILKIYGGSPYKKFIHFIGPVEEQDKPFFYFIVFTAVFRKKFW